MILLIGTTPDDILYYQNRMKLTATGEIQQGHPYYIGTFAGKEIALTYTGNSNLMSAVIASFMVKKFEPYLVIMIGSLYSADEGLKQGDLFIAERLYMGDVDYASFEDLHFSQALHMSSYYTTDDQYIKYIEILNSQAYNLKLVRGPLISMNKFFVNLKDTKKVVDAQDNYLGGATAFDTEAGGVVAACNFMQTPWLLLKAVSYEIGQDNQLISFVRKGLEAQPSIGHLIELLFNFLNTSVEEAV